MESGRLQGKSFLPPGKKIHQFLTLLFSDFYRPFRVGEVFSELFSDEKFNIFSPPLRVHQLAFRTRKMLDDAEVPIRIDEHAGAYRFQLDPNIQVRLISRTVTESTEDCSLRILRQFFNHADFSMKEAGQTLQISNTTAGLVLHRGLELGWIKRHGAGPKTTYQFDTQAMARSRKRTA
jgi:hypothetical protein